MIAGERVYSRRALGMIGSVILSEAVTTPVILSKTVADRRRHCEK